MAAREKKEEGLFVNERERERELLFLLSLLVVVVVLLLLLLSPNNDTKSAQIFLFRV